MVGLDIDGEPEKFSDSESSKFFDNSKRIRKSAEAEKELVVWSRT